VTAVPRSAGVGLRFQHHREVLEAQPRVGWLEVHTENYLGGGPSPHTLDRVRALYPVSLHGVGLSLGSACGLDTEHLAKVRQAVVRFEPGLVSEHLSWSATDTRFVPDLLPLPMTEEALEVVCRNVDHMQAAIGRTILLENPSSYVQFAVSTIPEWEFLAEVARRTGCGLLCDVNNLYVSACNHGWDAERYLRSLPANRIGEIHLAGHSTRQLSGGAVLRVDDHASAVCDGVWELYARAAEHFGPLPTLIEWDNDVPVLSILLAEARKADEVMEACSHAPR
jgi:uncharacterized protein (UPF0276 family)